MKIRETVKQIKNEFEFNANDFMARVDRTQMYITWRQGWKVKEAIKPADPSLFLITKGSTTVGGTYYALDKRKPFFAKNVNCTVPFPQGISETECYTHDRYIGKLEKHTFDPSKASYGKWTCRHYAFMDIALRYKGLKGSHAVKRAHAFADGERMKELVREKPNLASWTNQLCAIAATDGYMVEMSGKTDFLYKMFKRQPLPKRGEKWVLPMMVNADCHAMTLTLKIAHRKDGKVQYSVTWYDPNLTFNHRKIRFDDLEDLRAFEWWRLIPDEDLAFYKSFSKDGDPDAKPVLWLFSPMPAEKQEELIGRLDWNGYGRIVAMREAKMEKFCLIKDEK